jgi:hypothetical protein
MKKYVYKSREYLNRFTRKTGNKIYESLGDLLTKEVKFAPALATAGFFGSWIAMNGFGAIHEYNEGLVDMALNGPYLGRAAGTYFISMEGLAFNGAGLILGMGGAFVLARAGNKLDDLVKKIESTLKPKDY